MISNKSISYKITLNRALVEACRKHHLRISKIARDATERELQEKLDRILRHKEQGVSMVCKEYFPAFTHSYDADCKNCKYCGYTESISTCRNANVRNAMLMNSKTVKS